MEGFYFTYGVSGKSVGHDYDGGYTYVYAPNFATATKLWRAMHQPDNDGDLKCAFIYSDTMMRDMGMKEDNLGNCHDCIVYSNHENKEEE